MFKILRNTFVHIPGVSKETEVGIWGSKVSNWDEFLENHSQCDIAESKKERICSHIMQSIEAYNKKDYSYFLDKLQSRDHWRAYPELKHKCCFLDIETTGLSKHRNDITLIGLYDGTESKIYVNGKNLDEFKDEIKKYDMVVTFNGKCFDVPFICAKYPEINFDMFHVDLRFVMRQIGFSGGLKRIEREIGINRDDELADIDGFEAVRLWKKYKRGDGEALSLLIKYNIADIENLKVMMDYAYDRLKEENLNSEKKY